jgi:hypothetical protein
MAFSPECPTHVMTATHTGAVLIGSCRTLQRFSRTKTADQILQYGQHPKVSFTVHSPRGKNSP